VASLFENFDHVVASFVNDGFSTESPGWYGQGASPILSAGSTTAPGQGAIVSDLDLTLHQGVSQITGVPVGIDAEPEFRRSMTCDLGSSEFIVNRLCG
jgi:hypothetical protein